MYVFSSTCKSVQHGVTQLQCLFSCADMIPFANAGNQEKVVDQGQARVIDLPPIESYPQASIQWFEQQGQHLPIPTETQVRIMHHTYSVLYVTVCFGTPVLPADLFVPSPGYEVPPDLATVPRPLVYMFRGSQCPQCRFECSEWRCRHRDVKRIISCCNDVMNPYKRSRPDRNAVLWLPTANLPVSRVCPTVCSPGTVPEVLTVILVK